MKVRLFMFYGIIEYNAECFSSIFLLAFFRNTNKYLEGLEEFFKV